MAKAAKKTKSQIILNHPCRFETVHATPYRGQQAGADRYIIVCSGMVHHIGKLVASLTSQADNSVYAAAGIHSMHGLYWVAWFKELPAPQAGGTRYHLLVGETGQDKGAGNRAIQVDVLVALPGSKGRQSRRVSLLNGNIPIQYPASNSTVGNSFIAAGAPANGVPDDAVMRLQNNPDVDGAWVDTGDNDIWMFQFNNVPDGTGYDLIVSNGTGGAGSNSPITVDGTQAPPQNAPDPPPPPQ